jgi:hypothetical protein
MPVRTYKQKGQSYGHTPTTIVAKIDGVVVYSGTVSTLDEPAPAILADADAVDLFSWTTDINFYGPKPIEITVAGNPLILGQTWCNFFGEAGGSADEFVTTLYADSNGVLDPLSDVTIDDITKEAIRLGSSSNGQYYWYIQPGSTFKATLNFVANQPEDATYWNYTTP